MGDTLEVILRHATEIESESPDSFTFKLPRNTVKVERHLEGWERRFSVVLDGRILWNISLSVEELKDDRFRSFFISAADKLQSLEREKNIMSLKEFYYFFEGK